MVVEMMRQDTAAPEQAPEEDQEDPAEDSGYQWQVHVATGGGLQEIILHQNDAGQIQSITAIWQARLWRLVLSAPTFAPLLLLSFFVAGGHGRFWEGL
jgi:hypothetical protein